MNPQILIAFILWLACLSSSLPISSRTHDSLNTQQPRKARLKCSPQKLFRGDTLNLEMATPHGGDLAVRAPDGTDFFVVFSHDREDRGAGPLMEQEEFMKIARLSLVTDKTKARPWVYGRDKSELIFTKTGWYQVRLSENLQTDDGTPVYQCRVYYLHRNRP